MHAKSFLSCLTLFDPPGSSVHGILQARLLEWVAMPSSRGSSQPRDPTHISYVSYFGSWVLYPFCCCFAQSCLTLCDPMDGSMPGFPVLHHLPQLVQTHVHWISDAIQTSHPLSSPSPHVFNPSQLQGFSNELALHIRWPKNWSFSFSISPSKEYSGLISFRTDWLDLLAVQRTLQSLLQHHSSEASVLWLSVFFSVQLSHPYMTTRKTIKCRDITFPTKVHLVKAMVTHLDVWKTRDITLPTKVHIIKAMVFSVVVYGCESWTEKKTESQRTDASELWCWRRLWRVLSSTTVGKHQFFGTQPS